MSRLVVETNSARVIYHLTKQVNQCDLLSPKSGFHLLAQQADGPREAGRPKSDSSVAGQNEFC